MVPIKIVIRVKKLHEDAVIPDYAKLGDSGMDVRSTKNLTIRPGEVVLVPTGLAFEIPIGWEIQVRPRSGLSLKTKLRISNSPGTIDSGYRGELCVIAENTSLSNDIVINKGDRIAQIVLNQTPLFELEEVEELSSSERGEDGFGSTRVN